MERSQGVYTCMLVLEGGCFKMQLYLVGVHPSKSLDSRSCDVSKVGWMSNIDSHYRRGMGHYRRIYTRHRIRATFEVVRPTIYARASPQLGIHKTARVSTCHTSWRPHPPDIPFHPLRPFPGWIQRIDKGPLFISFHAKSPIPDPPSMHHSMEITQFLSAPRPAISGTGRGIHPIRSRRVLWTTLLQPHP